MIFSPSEFDGLRELAFRSDYSGYKPNVREIPNGDGKVDAEKRYSHIASKYLRGDSDSRLWQALYRCHDRACQVADLLDLPKEWRPNLNASALRVLEYPPGADGARHTDFDLFTLLAYRDPLEGLEFEATEGDPTWPWAPNVRRALREQAPGIHWGELFELSSFGEATPHYVDPMNRWQFSAVYFCLPNPETRLPERLEADAARKYDAVDGERVGDWLARRYARSRVEGYK